MFKFVKKANHTCSCGAPFKACKVKSIITGVNSKQECVCTKCKTLSSSEDTVYHCTGKCHNFNLCTQCITTIEAKPASLNVECKCGDKLVLTTPRLVYGLPAACNQCSATIDKFSYFYHCPKQFCDVHPLGFDYCINCAERYSHSTPDQVTILHLESTISNQSKKITELESKVSELSGAVKTLKQEKESLLSGLQFDVFCKCDQQMILTRPIQTIAMSPVCSACQQIIWQKEWAYHCPAEHNIKHPSGFDLCFSCSIKKQQSIEKLEKCIADQQQKLNGFQGSLSSAMIIILNKQMDKIEGNTLAVVKELQGLNQLQHVTVNQLITTLSSTFNPGKPSAIASVPSLSAANAGLESSPDVSTPPPLTSFRELQVLNTRIASYHESQNELSQNARLLVHTSKDRLHRSLAAWNTWNADEIVDWIVSLENGLFAKYETVMREKMGKSNVSGSELSYVEKSDLESFGVQLFADRVCLNRAIKDLVSKDNQIKVKRDKIEFRCDIGAPFDSSHRLLQPGGAIARSTSLPTDPSMLDRGSSIADDIEGQPPT